MAWVRLDDQARQHRKLLAAGPTAAWLWVCGLMYCNSQKAHDGIIPSVAVPVLYPIPNWRKEAARLVAVGLWEQVGDDYAVHDYHEYQLTAEEVENLSLRRAQAGRAGGLRSAERRRSNGQANDQANRKQTGSKRVANLKQLASFCLPSKSKQNEAHPDPIPIPSPLDPSDRVCVPPAHEAKTKQVASRATKEPEIPLPPDFGVSPELERICRAEGLPNPHDVLPDFRDWAEEKQVRKARWEATFRRWMRSKITRERYPKWEADPTALPIFRLPDRERDIPRGDEAPDMTSVLLGGQP
jgi:hypothetical protein